MRYSKEEMIPEISDEVKKILVKMKNSYTISGYLAIRSKIILLSVEGKSNQDISKEVGLHYNSVAKWRTRFINMVPAISIIEEASPDDVDELIQVILSDEYRSGAPCKYDNTTRSLIKLIACQSPDDYGFTASHWSLRYLKEALIQNKVVEDISLGAIAHILKADSIRPWKIRYYLHSKEKYESYETYKQKIEAINALYAEAVTLGGTDENSEFRIFSTDEMTGLQALEHLFPDKPVQPGVDAKREFEYIRHGTTSFTGFYNVVTGEMSTPYLNKTRNEQDFVEALKQVVETDPSKEYRIVCDNLNTHMSESLVRYVASQIGYEGDIGIKGKAGILSSKETRAEFLSDSSHRIRFYYVPIHCSWMNQIEIWFGIINRQLLKRKSFKSVEELERDIRDFIIQYNKYFAHPFKWSYNSVPENPNSSVVGEHVA